MNEKIFFLGRCQCDEVATNEPDGLSTLQQRDHAGSILNLTAKPEPHCLTTQLQQAMTHQVVPQGDGPRFSTAMRGCKKYSTILVLFPWKWHPVWQMGPTNHLDPQSRMFEGVCTPSTVDEPGLSLVSSYLSLSIYIYPARIR
jgi:hypothetical protein